MAFLETQRRQDEILAFVHRRPLRPLGFDVVAGDFANTATLVEDLRRFQPDWVLHAAAATDVEWCESNPVSAWDVNVRGTASVVHASRCAGARVLVVSTDSVYGDQGPHDERSATRPLNVYARTKLEAERVTAAIVPDALVARVNFVGWRADGGGLLGWALREMRAGRSVRGWSDVWFTPLAARDLASTLLDMMDRRLQGLYCVGGSDGLSKLEFLRRVAEIWGFAPGSVEGGPARVGELTARPQDTRLTSTRLEAELGRPLPGILSGLSALRSREAETMAFLRRVQGQQEAER